VTLVEQPADIRDLREQFDAIERDAKTLTDGLTEATGTWREDDGSWSVAGCFDHLAIGNGLYVQALREGAARARKRGRFRRGPAAPGLIGGWFASFLEPPAGRRFRLKAPRKIVPRRHVSLEDAFSRFIESHRDVKRYLEENADLDLAGSRFANPFIPGVRFSLATGLQVTTAHERRHLWQAWRIRRAAEQHSHSLSRVARLGQGP